MEENVQIIELYEGRGCLVITAATSQHDFG